MNDINHTIVIGRLVRDGDFGYIISGTARLNLSIAVNRSVKKNGAWTDSVSYFDVTVWGKTAENIKAYLHKGKQIAVDGYIDQQRWEKDGQKFSKVVIVANTVQLLGGNENNAAPQEPAGDYQSAGSDDDFPDEIPF